MSDAAQIARSLLDPLQGAALSPTLCREARLLLGWSMTLLATRARVSKDTLRGFERGSLTAGAAVQGRLRRALEAAGIEVIDGQAPGVQLRSSPRAA
jgi:predicted transcriptional regulator